MSLTKIIFKNNIRVISQPKVVSHQAHCLRARLKVVPLGMSSLNRPPRGRQVQTYHLNYHLFQILRNLYLHQKVHHSYVTQKQLTIRFR